MPRRRRPARPGALADLAPKKILAQIVILQLLYYAVAAALILFTTLVAGRDVTADSLLSWRTVRSDVTTGWMLGLCWMMDSMIWYVADYIPLASYLLTRLRQQCHLPATLHRPIQTRSRLCNHHPRHQPDSHHLLHKGTAYTTLLVGPSVLQRCSYDLPRRLGLSVERTQAHIIWRKIKATCLRRRSSRCRGGCWFCKRRKRRWP
jgi:hypothetical protein